MGYKWGGRTQTAQWNTGVSIRSTQDIAAYQHSVWYVPCKTGYRSGHFRFVFAQRALCAAAIRARPSALIVLRFRVEPAVCLVGNPRFNGAV